ncbi:MAG: hypothetical protein AAFR55_01285 [Pseudomonadota bacterium]
MERPAHQADVAQNINASTFCQTRPPKEPSMHPCQSQQLERQKRLGRLRRLLERVERRHGLYARLDRDPSQTSRIASGAPMVSQVGARGAHQNADHQRAAVPDAASSDGDVASSAWTFGAPDIDEAIGAAGLSRACVHEFKSAIETYAGNTTVSDANAGRDGSVWAAQEAATFGLMLALAGRSARAPVLENSVLENRVPETAGVALRGNADAVPDLVICRTQAAGREWGRIYGNGLTRLGVAPSRIVLVETRDDADCLWALEEALRSRAARAVVGVVADVGLTPARRLALAADQGATPCLMMTHRATPAMAATQSRWRVSTRPARPHPLADEVPDKRSYALQVERMRGAADAVRLAAENKVFALEWCHETFRFDLVPGVRDRALAPRHAPAAASTAVLSQSYAASGRAERAA